MDYKPNVYDLQPEIQILKVIKPPNTDEFMKKDIQKNPSTVKSRAVACLG